MDEGARNAGVSGGVIKNRNSTGCLIIKKKLDEAGDGVGYSGPDIVYTRKEKKRQRLAESDSESSEDELLEFYRRRIGSNQVSTSDSSRVKKGAPKWGEFARQKKGMDLDFARDDIFPEARKRTTLDVYDFDEYDDLDDVDKGYFDAQASDRNFAGAKMAMRSGSRRELVTGSSKHGVLMSDRKRPFFDSTSSEKIRGGSSSFDGGFGIKSKLPVPVQKERFESSSNEAIRLQGKNGVLKLMVKNKVGGASVAKKFEEVEGSNMSRSREITPKNSMARRPVYLEKKVLNDPTNADQSQRQIGKMKSRKLLPSKVEEDSDEKSEESEEPPRVLSSNAKTPRPTKRGRSETEVTPSPESVQASKSKEAKVKRGSGTEKQLLREKIRSMLVGAGWTIDYRPRRNRDYFDAVYINPGGTAYWSIIKAYDALQKQIEEDRAKIDGENPGIDLISDDVLSKLTRQTQKKLEKEMKRKNREANASKRKKKAASGKFVNDDPETDCTDSGSDEDKLSSFIKQSGISKGRLHEFRNGNGRNQAAKMQQRIEKQAASSHSIHGRKTKKIGRCTLLVRNADKELNSEDSFVPFRGKRTILSWLIDSGTVKLSEKVLYMNRRRTRVILEGWITRDGIHCSCCSKIVTVSKFEIHAAGKLRQPYQNICLPSGESLLQCQVDAWNSQGESQRTGFNTVDVDGDDPNDDTCGICGDGGNLICCDGCPSTLHQSCVGIEMLPLGDWHCPHCSCKFCGLADADTSQTDESTSNELVQCSLCERKYHKTCIPEENSISNNSTNQISFCGRKCQELFEQLQKLLGVKHDLESGLSWSLIHRNDLDADPSHRGFSQKVEWNAKLAVALTVMDECFLPINDRRSGINLIQNVLYNCRSNFNRLNYGGFYTAILERGEEIISAASIRIHGNQLAEMPFIGTRHIYRRQGMCRRLLFAIELALRSLKVEKLIIPAISDMMHTWTKVFGFSELGDSHKQEMKSLNMLVFPGTDMLQKKLVKPVTSKKDVAACKGADLCEDDGGSSPLPDLTKGSDMESSASEASAGDPYPHNDLSIEKPDALQNDHVVEESDAAISLQHSGVSLNAVFLPTLALDVRSDIQGELKECKASQDTEISSDMEDKLVKSLPENIKVDFSSEASTQNLHASTEGVKSDRQGNKVASAHSGSEVVDGSMVGIPDLASDVKKPFSLDASHDSLLMGKPVLDSPTEFHVQAVEVVINAPSETNDNTVEVDSASKPVPTSPMMIRPCMDDSNEFDPLTGSVELDSAADDSIQPHLESKLDASLVISAKIRADSTSDPSGASVVTTVVCSDGIDEHALQAKESKADSSDNAQMHLEGERYPASEVKAADPNHLAEASGVSSNGTLMSVPCSDSTNEPRPHVLVEAAADHSQMEHFDAPVPDMKLTSISGGNNEFQGMQTLESNSPIEQMASDPIENGSDSTHNNHIEVAGSGPGCNSASDGLTQISKC